MKRVALMLTAAMGTVALLALFYPSLIANAAEVASPVEGENFANKPSGTTVVSATLFSGGQALKFTVDVTASHTVTCNAVCDVVLMARAGQSGGTPSFRVNGSAPQAITTSTQVAPEPYTFDVNLPAGSNTIRVTTSGTGTGHNAFLDVAKFPADGGGGGTPAAACADGLDNDGDGNIDLNDPGCSSSTDNDETDPLAATPPVTLVGAGDIAECSQDNNAEATAALLADIPGTVLALGDNAYPDGTRTQYANCYDNYSLSGGSTFDVTRTSWWGQYKARTMPVLGNHEYHFSKVAQPYFDYFSANQAVGFKQPAAPVPNTTANPGLTPGKGYYSYDRGSWHIVALNSNCNKVGGCERTSTQGKWLQNNLANTTNKQCTLAYFHHPLYSTGNNIPNLNVKPLWQILYNNHADVILNGHAHRYERYAPLTPGGTTDLQNGIRQFVAGTGGAPGGSEIYYDQAPGEEVVETGTSGVLKLDLSAGSYSWTFVPIAGQTFTDSGNGSCH